MDSTWTAQQQEIADLRLELECLKDISDSCFDALYEAREQLMSALQIIDSALDPYADDDEPDPHDTETMTTPAGKIVDIDVLMVPVVQALWDAGVETRYCCQGGKWPGSDANRGYVSGPRTSSVERAQEVLLKFNRPSVADDDDGTPTWAIRFDPFLAGDSDGK